MSQPDASGSEGYRFDPIDTLCAVLEEAYGQGAMVVTDARWAASFWAAIAEMDRRLVSDDADELRLELDRAIGLLGRCGDILAERDIEAGLVAEIDDQFDRWRSQEVMRFKLVGVELVEPKESDESPLAGNGEGDGRGSVEDDGCGGGNTLGTLEP